MVENIELILLHEIATILYDDGINCRIEEYKNLISDHYISFSYARSNNSNIFANISICDGEIRIETVRIQIASPTAIEELLYYIKNGVTMIDEK